MLNKQSLAANIASKPPWVVLALAFLIAVVPRGIRILYPQAWFEDAAYLYHAFRLLSGQQPFVDGIYAHPPTLEGLLAFLYAVFGVSYRVAEILSAVVMAATTLLVLHLTKGGTASFWSNLHNIIIPNLNYLLVLGTGGLILGVLRERRGIVIAAGIYAAEILLFFSVLSGTLWAHNMIDMLLPLSLGTALAVGQIFSPGKMRKDKVKTFAIIAVPAVVFILAGAMHLRHLKAGWGYVPREELVRAAAFVRQNVPATRFIIAPHYLAAEATRLKLIDYRELTGPYLWLLQRIKQEGYAGLRRHRQFGSWKRMVHRTAPLWQSVEIEAIRARQVGAVIWDEVFPEWAYYQKAAGEMEAKSGLYSKAGYQVRYVGGPYVIWLPE